MTTATLPLIQQSAPPKISYLLTVGSDAKTVKGEKLGFLTGIQYLAPSTVSGIVNLCPKASEGCKIACLNTAGRGGIIKKGETTNTIEIARLRRTLLFLDEREKFLAQLHKEITAFVIRCKKNDKKPCVRLNGTSDIQWEYELHEGKNMFEHFPEVQFYDYTKIPTRKVDNIPNYHLTWSYSEANEKYAKMFDQVPNNKAVVFRDKELPSMFKGLKVINGDDHDMRFLDKPNSVVGLKAKGKARKDYTGFVIDAIQI